jgi:hypothetical protein
VAVLGWIAGNGRPVFVFVERLPEAATAAH